MYGIEGYPEFPRVREHVAAVAEGRYDMKRDNLPRCSRGLQSAFTALWDRTIDEWHHRTRRRRMWDEDGIVRSVSAFASANGITKRVVLADTLSSAELRAGILHLYRQEGELAPLCDKRRNDLWTICHSLLIPVQFAAARTTFFPVLTLSTMLTRRFFPRMGRLQTFTFSEFNKMGTSLAEFSIVGFAEFDATFQIITAVLNADSPPALQSSPLLSFLTSLEHLRRGAASGLGWILETHETLIALPLPEMYLDSNSELHHPRRSAVRWHEGTEEYYWHGVQVEADLILRPRDVSAGRILNERNAEVRRILIERKGIDRLFAECNAEVLHQDIDEGGTRQLLRISLKGDEPIVAVNVTCPSTGRNYILRVPPTTKSCDEAIAWTFGFDRKSYKPIIET